VERRELGQTLQRGDHLVVEQRRLPEGRPAVHDAVRDGPNGGRRVVERLHRLGRLVGGDD